MTNKEMIYNFLYKESLIAFCDDCIKAQLKLSHRQVSNAETRLLLSEKRIDKNRRKCSLCHKVKLSSSVVR